GETIEYNFDAASNTLTAFVDLGEGGVRDVFQITFDLDAPGNTGTFTFTLIDQLDHPVAGSEDDINIPVNLAIVDGNGTQINCDLHVIVNDDSPVINVTGESPTLTVDETVLTTDATADFSTAFTSSFGADGAGTIAYGLGVVAGPSGLVDTATGEVVN